MDGLALPGAIGLAAEYFFKTTAVLTLALIASAALRRRPAAIRHFVMASALIGLLLLPLLSLVPAGWRTPLLPSRPASAAMMRLLSSPGVPLGDPSPTEKRLQGSHAGDHISGTSGSYSPLRSASPPAAAESFQGFADGPKSYDRPVGIPKATSEPVAAASHGALSTGTKSPSLRSSGPLLDMANAAVRILWVAGLSLLLLRLAVGLAGAARLTARAETLAGPAWRLLLERFMRLVALRREVVVKGHPAVLVPLTWGWRKPVVLMPAGADSWTEEERSTALCHELSHIKRADFLVMLAVRASLALFWWNPLCWIVYRTLLKEQELACDELVLRAGIRPSTYAASLLAFRRTAGFRWNPSAALLGLMGRTTFSERLAAILKQQVPFKEVPMRTKFMLAGALALAVALVGTSRPAVAGVEKAEAPTVLAETALPSPAGLEVTLPSWSGEQEKAEKAASQEQEKEKKKAKEAERSIVIKAEKGGQSPLVITITEGDTVKTLTLDKPLTIIDGKDGKSLILSSEGKEIKVLRGEPLRLEIEGGGLKVLKEGEWIESGKSGVLKIVKEGEEGRSIVFYGRPEDIDEGVKIIKEGQVIKVQPGKRLIVKEDEILKEGVPVIAWTAKEPGEEGGIWVVKGSTDKPGKAVWVSAHGSNFDILPFGDKGMLEKVRALQEQVAAIKANKLDLSALEESLKKLEAELKANEEKLKELNFKFEKVPAPPKPEKAPAIAAKPHPPAPGAPAPPPAPPAPAAPKAAVFVGTGENDEGRITLMFTGHEGEAGRADFERAVAAVKKEMPADYKIVEQKFDPKEGTMTFVLQASEGLQTDEKNIRRLVDAVKDALKK